jgi:hypothetical protein
LRQAFDLLQQGLVVVWGFGALALLGLIELAHAPETRAVPVLGFLDFVEYNTLVYIRLTSVVLNVRSRTVQNSQLLLGERQNVLALIGFKNLAAPLKIRAHVRLVYLFDLLQLRREVLDLNLQSQLFFH